MEIRGYLKTSAIEWPGKISAVFFVPGCNFRCPFCYNRDLVLNPQKLPKFSEKEVFEDLKKRKKWVDAVIVTGGEPTLQTDLSRFLSRCKQMRFLTMIETNGSFTPILQCIVARGLVDRVAMDIKGPLDARYTQISNFPALPAGRQFPISNIKKSIKLIFQSGIDFEIRTTVVPGIHDKKTLVLMAKQLREIQRNPKTKKLRWYLQTFQPKTCLDPKFEKIKPYSKMEMEKFLKAVKKIIPQTSIR